VSRTSALIAAWCGLLASSTTYREVYRTPACTRSGAKAPGGTPPGSRRARTPPPPLPGQYPPAYQIRTARGSPHSAGLLRPPVARLGAKHRTFRRTSDGGVRTHLPHWRASSANKTEAAYTARPLLRMDSGDRGRHIAVSLPIVKHNPRPKLAEWHRLPDRPPLSCPLLCLRPQWSGWQQLGEVRQQLNQAATDGWLG
jgi:hypothetical protein